MIFKLKGEMDLGKAPYKTKQMTELLTFLKSVQGSHVTVNDICAYFQTKGLSIGTTTVYRQLEKMVKEGLVAKYIVDGTSSACFEYIGSHEGDNPEACYHCKCETCGKLIHLRCNEVESLKQHMMEHHSFEMDSLRTVFYGVCSECKKRQNEKPWIAVSPVKSGMGKKKQDEKPQCDCGRENTEEKRGSIE